MSNKKNLATFRFYLIAGFAYVVIRLLYATYRFRIQGVDHRETARKLSPLGSYVLSCWHQNVLACTLSQVGIRYCPLASQSKDGAYIAFIMERFGFTPVRGSSSRGGTEALRLLIDLLKGGRSTAITVDGPRGPKGVVKPGAIDLARRTGVPILPMTAVPHRYWEMHKSWDRFRLPKPFSVIDVYYDKPILLAQGIEGAEFDLARQKLADHLNELDRHFEIEKSHTD